MRNTWRPISIFTSNIQILLIHTDKQRVPAMTHGKKCSIIGLVTPADFLMVGEAQAYGTPERIPSPLGLISVRMTDRTFSSPTRRSANRVVALNSAGTDILTRTTNHRRKGRKVCDVSSVLGVANLISPPNPPSLNAYSASTNRVYNVVQKIDV